MPPTDPDAGEGCAYRAMCAAYRRLLSPEERLRCEGEKPAGQAESGPRRRARIGPRCHYPDRTKAHGPGTPSHVHLGRAMDAGAGEEVLLEVRKVRKTFSQGQRSFLALNDISLDIHKGRTYALVGESGSGKSTLGLSIMALQGVDGGEILYAGRDVLKLDKASLRGLRKRCACCSSIPKACSTAE